MQHPDKGTIHSWLDGALSADEAARVEAHVNDCPQCAVVVAEARGFIAAASRILTALDNAPSGVVPVQAPKKGVDSIVWRVAATLLVVAAGTFAVFRNGGREAPIIVTSDGNRGSSAVKAAAPSAVAPPAADRVEPLRETAKAVPSITMQGNTTRAVAGGGSQANAFSGKRATAKAGAADMSTGTENARTPVAPPVAYTAKAAALPSQANTPAPTPQLLSPAGMSRVAALDAASEAPLRIIGTPRQIGARITLYEVTPGDTVTLTEIENLQLQSVVVTGLSKAPTAGQSTEKSAAAPAAKRASAPVLSAPDSQHSEAAPAAPAPAQATLALTRNPQVANGVTTISWADPVTGNVMKLSGRMPETRLRQIKTRIERERATAAAKKKP